jgi:SAM-dependent methyltransferase
MDRNGMLDTDARQGAIPPMWALKRPKPIFQSLYDLALAPARMLVLPDRLSERIGVTSLRAERFAAALRYLKGRVLDIGAGDNALIHAYRALAPELGVSPEDADESVGVDVVDWDADCRIVDSSTHLPFPDESFDTVVFLACINHIPERDEALREAGRVLRRDGRLVVSMIGPIIGTIGHAIWFYSEDKHRDVHEDEKMGMSSREIRRLIANAGFVLEEEHPFVYRLNRLYIARKS